MLPASISVPLPSLVSVPAPESGFWTLTTKLEESKNAPLAPIATVVMFDMNMPLFAFACSVPPLKLNRLTPAPPTTL